MKWNRTIDRNSAELSRRDPDTRGQDESAHLGRTRDVFAQRQHHLGVALLQIITPEILAS